MDEVQGRGALPPRQPEMFHLHGVAAGADRGDHLIDQVSPGPAVKRFFDAIPPKSSDGGYTNPEQFHEACGALFEEILHRARLPSSVKVDLSAIGDHLETDPSLDPSSPPCARRVEYLIESTARFLVEIYHNCQGLETEYGALREIKATDGDPHHGKRPCFVTFVKAPSSKFHSLFSKGKESCFVYKPRNMIIEQATLPSERGLFHSLNRISVERGLFHSPPLRTRTIISGDNWGLHEFVSGEYLNPRICGNDYSDSNFGPKLLSKGFTKDGGVVDRYIFLEEVIRHCGLGNDAHIGNFIFNGDELFAEPIDLEVYVPHSTESSAMPTIDQMIRAHRRDYESLKPRIDEKRRIFREFLETTGKEAVDDFRTSISNSTNPFIRYVPVNTSLLNDFLGYAADEDDFIKMISHELELKLDQFKYQFIPSTNLMANLKRCYREKNVPLFQLSANGEFVYYEGEMIARKQHG